MSLWIGTYSRNGGSGLHPLTITDGGPIVGEAHTDIANASYAVWSPRHRLAYFVDEQDAGRVTAWRRADGCWTEVSAMGSGGSAPCYLGLASAGDRLAVANYEDGSIGLFLLDHADGAIVDLIGMAQARGQGVDPERQAGPHAHCTVFAADGTWLFHVDLGLDRILAYPLTGDELGEPELAFAAPTGSGPRHLVLHPDGRRALLICELSAEIHLLKREGHAFTAVASQPTSTRQGSSPNLGCHLALSRDGTRAIMTNRGHDSLVVSRLGDTSLDREREIAIQGTSPRHFWTDGAMAVVANEGSGNVVVVDLAADRPGAAADIPGACFVLSIPD